MSSVIRVMLLFLTSFAALLVLGYYAQQHPWWHDWGAKAAIITWFLIWLGASVCWIAPHIDDHKEQ